MLFSCGFTLSLFYHSSLSLLPLCDHRIWICFLIELSTITLSPSLLLALVLFWWPLKISGILKDVQLYALSVYTVAAVFLSKVTSKNLRNLNMDQSWSINLITWIIVDLKGPRLLSVIKLTNRWWVKVTTLSNGRQNNDNGSLFRWVHGQ